MRPDGRGQELPARANKSAQIVKPRHVRAAGSFLGSVQSMAGRKGRQRAENLQGLYQSWGSMSGGVGRAGLRGAAQLPIVFSLYHLTFRMMTKPYTDKNM